MGSSIEWDKSPIPDNWVTIVYFPFNPQYSSNFSPLNSINEMSDCNVAWSDKKSIASFHEKLNNFGVPIRSRDFTKELANDSDAKCLRIRMSVVDSRNCQGPLVNTTIPLKTEEHSKNVSRIDKFLRLQ